MEIVLLLIRLFLFGVFALAGIGKLLDLPGSERAVKAFGVPDSLAKPVSIGLPIFELVLAFAFLTVATSWFAAVAAVLLISVFLGGMIYQIAQGNAPDCHCFGQIHSEPVGKSSLIRNGVFAVLALFLAIQGSASQGASLAGNDSGMSSFILVLILAGLAVGIYFLKMILDQQGEIMKRLDVLEIISRDGGQVERVEAVPPTEGLAIGSPFPEFALTSLDGKTITRTHLFASSRSKLFFFVSPDCGPCKALYPEIRKWQQEFGDRLDMVFVTTGTLEANQKQYGDAEGITVLLQEKRELAEILKSQWTPAALFVNASGMISSYVSTGDKAINTLIEDIRLRDISDPDVYIATTAGHNKPLLIGESVPEFSLEGSPDLPTTLADVNGRRTLAIFWSHGCPHCRNMRDEIAEWEKARGADDANLVIFSDGDREQAQALELQSPVLLDTGYEVSKALGMLGTPSAVVIDANGRIASGTAMGAEKIWALIGKR